MTAFRTYRHDFTLFKAESLASDARVPADGYVVKAYRRGATSSQAKTVGTGGGVTLTVYDIGDLQVNDTVQLGADATQTRTISAIGSGLLTFAAGGTGTFAVSVGSRLVPTNNRPRTYINANFGSPESGGQVTANFSGMGSFYTRQRIIDCIIDDGTGLNTSVIVDQMGLGSDTESPFQWNAVGDGVTDDTAAFRAIIARALADGINKVVIPPGTYLLSSIITLAAASGLTFSAQIPGTVAIQIGVGSGVGIDLTGACTDIAFEDVTFNITSTNVTAIQTSTTTSRFVCRRCTFIVGNLRTGVLEQGTDARFIDCIFVGSTPVTWIRLNGAQRAQISGCFGSWSGNATGRIIDIDTGCRAIRIVNTDLKGNTTANSAASGVVGVRNSAAGTSPRDIILMGCHFQAGTAGRGVDIDAVQGFQAIGCTMEDCLVGYSIDGGTSIKIIGGLCVGIQNEAVDINGGSHVRIVELESSDVSQATPNNFDHVNIAAGLDDISIFGISAGNFIRGGAIKCRRIVTVEAGLSDRIQILGLRGVLADINGYFLNSSTSKDVDIGHNVQGGLTATFAHTAMPGGDNASVGVIVGTLRLTDATTAPNVQNVHTVIHSPSGNVTYTALNGASDGQVVRIVNIHATNTIDLADGATFRMAGNMTLGQYDSISLLWSADQSTWIEIGRSNN